MVLGRVDADDLPALAVRDLGRVDPGDDAIADGEVLAADDQGVRSPTAPSAASSSRARSFSSATSRVRRAIITASSPAA